MSDRARETLTGSAAAPSADCVSDLALDRHGTGELSAQESAALSAHLSTCARCRDRRDALERAEPPSAELRAAVLARVRASPVPLDDRRRPARPARVARVLAIAAGLGVAIGATLALRSGSLRRPPEDAVRTKGSLALSVFRERDGAVERPSSGGVFRAGDRLRFGIDVPVAGHLMIVGVEPSGRIYIVHPSDGSDRSVATAAPLEHEILPGAIELDDSVGRESLELIVCPEPFTTRDLRPHPAGGALELPGGCSGSIFWMTKER